MKSELLLKREKMKNDDVGKNESTNIHEEGQSISLKCNALLPRGGHLSPLIAS